MKLLSRALSMKRQARSIGIAPVLAEWRMALAERISEQRLAVLFSRNRNQRAWTALIISSEGPPRPPLHFPPPFSLPHSLSLLLYINTNGIILICCLLDRCKNVSAGIQTITEANSKIVIVKKKRLKIPPRIIHKSMNPQHRFWTLRPKKTQKLMNLLCHYTNRRRLPLLYLPKSMNLPLPQPLLQYQKDHRRRLIIRERHQTAPKDRTAD